MRWRYINSCPLSNVQLLLASDECVNRNAGYEMLKRTIDPFGQIYVVLIVCVDPISKTVCDNHIKVASETNILCNLSVEELETSDDFPVAFCEGLAGD